MLTTVTTSGTVTTPSPLQSPGQVARADPAASTTATTTHALFTSQQYGSDGLQTTPTADTKNTNDHQEIRRTLGPSWSFVCSWSQEPRQPRAPRTDEEPFST
jgi:hypothetical protein